MRRIRGVWLAAALALVGCHDHPHGEHGHEEHAGHAGHAGHDDHAGHAGHDNHAGHGHGEGSTAYTTYADRTELFIEVPPLIVGEPVQLAAHLTRLDNYRPVMAGRVTIMLTGGGLPDEIFDTGQVRVSGIFRPSVIPEEPCLRTMKLRVVTADIDEVHTVGNIEVFMDLVAEAAAHGHGDEEAPVEEEISFTKEQQWRIDFGTAPVSRRPIRPAFEAYGTIRARPDGQAIVTAPLPGRLSMQPGVPRVGQEVERDQIVAMLTPQLPNAADLAGLEQAVEEARLAKSQTSRTVRRLEGLLAAGGVAERRVLDARYEHEQAVARYKRARARWKQREGLQSTGGAENQKGIPVRSPLTGTIVETHVVPGAYVESGADMLHVVDLDRLWLEVHVTETHAKYLDEPQGVWFRVPGFDDVYERGPEHVVAVGGVLDVRTRTIPLYVSIDNPKRRLRVGMFADVHVLTDAPHSGIAIPASAIVYDAGLPVVYVALSGEAFASRQVRLGQRDGAMIEVLEGVLEGERVVSVGAYAVRLATAATQVPEHGHHH
jgi:cobalt-zinc-cadmium efflux system membrane fusion protein